MALDLARDIRKSHRILILCGAGISTSAGIPDFRSEGTGLYNVLAQRYGIEDPQELFNLESFQQDPLAFWACFKDFHSLDKVPTPAHRFIYRVEQAKKLQRLYTQNIDGLEQSAGITRVLHCHGTTATSTCLVCSLRYETRLFMQDILLRKMPSCPNCQQCTRPQVRSSRKSTRLSGREGDSARPAGCIKPDLVFFGEEISATVISTLQRDLLLADLIIIIGTSLNVAPINAYFAEECGSQKIRPKPARPTTWYINRQPGPSACRFDRTWLGDCDVILDQVGRCLQEATHD